MTARADMAEESVNELTKEKSEILNQNADLARQCADLRQQTSTLTVSKDTGEFISRNCNNGNVVQESADECVLLKSV